MRRRSKFSPRQIEEIYLTEIASQFTNHLPTQVQELHNSVPMEICMATLLTTGFTGSTIEQGVEMLSAQLQDEDEDNIEYWEELSDEDSAEIQKLPSPHQIRKTLLRWPKNTITSRFRKIVQQQIKTLKKSGFFKRLHSKEGITAAFDMTEVGYFGAEDEYTLHSHGRTVAKRCHSYLSLQIVCPGFRLILDVEPVFTHNKPIGNLMAKMLKRMRQQLNLKFKHIYLDRGFYQIEVLAALREHYSSQTLMPAIRTKRVKDAIIEWHGKNGFKAGMLDMELGSGKDTQAYTLIFSPHDGETRQKIRKAKKKKGKEAGVHEFFLYFCVLKPPEVSKSENMEAVFKRLSYDYRNRWGIETGYRVVKTIWGWTTSNDYTLRLWLMWNSITLYNLWVLTNLDLIEKKGVPGDYVCCSKQLTLEEIKQADNITQQKDYPGWARASSEKPKRKWVPRPMDLLRRFMKILNLIAVRQVKRVLDSGYQPP